MLFHIYFRTFIHKVILLVLHIIIVSTLLVFVCLAIVVSLCGVLNYVNVYATDCGSNTIKPIRCPGCNTPMY